MQGCSGHYILETRDIKEVRNHAIPILREAGFRAYTRGSSADYFKAEGIKGNQLLAIGTNQIPWLPLIGSFSRVKAKILCQRNLNKGKDELHLHIQVYPIMEIRDDREWGLGLTQDLGEVIGDNLQARRSFRRIVEGFHLLGLKELTGDETLTGDSQDRSSREQAKARIELFRALRILKAIRILYSGLAITFGILIFLLFILHSNQRIETDTRNTLVFISAFMAIVTTIGTIQIISHPRFWSIVIAAIWTSSWLFYFCFLPFNILMAIFALVSSYSLWRTAISAKRIIYLLEKHPDLIISKRMLGKA